MKLCRKCHINQIEENRMFSYLMSHLKTFPRAIGKIKKINDRGSFYLFSLYKGKGSITIETALVLPIFMFAMISIMYMSSVIHYSNNVTQGLHQSAREMAKDAYLSSINSKVSVEELGSRAAGIVLSETFVKNKVNDVLDKDNMKSGNISYIRSNIMKNDIIDLIADEEINLPYEFWGLGSFRILDRARVHAFTGYDNTRNTSFDNKNIDEEIVYITKNGTVYHKDQYCSHLKVIIEKVSESQVESCRNDSGGKYYRCEYCGGKKAGGIYYLTKYGDRFHSSIDCGALKRDVKAVPISKVEGRRACLTCGGSK